jgi:hypothetical protein
MAMLTYGDHFICKYLKAARGATMLQGAFQQPVQKCLPRSGDALR